MTLRIVEKWRVNTVKGYIEFPFTELQKATQYALDNKQAPPVLIAEQHNNS